MAYLKFKKKSIKINNIFDQDIPQKILHVIIFKI